MQEINVMHYGDRSLLGIYDNQGEDAEVWLPACGKETLVKDQLGQVYLIKALSENTDG